MRSNSLAASTQHAGAAGAAAVVPKAGCVFELRTHGRRVLLHGGNLATAQAAAAPRKPPVRGNHGGSKAKRAAQPNQQRAAALSWEL